MQKTALVTGGAKRVGRSICLGLAEAGYAVAVHHNSSAGPADELVAEAVEQTGFRDFGSLPYREGLDVLLATYDRHVPDPEGRQRCRDRVLTLLATRLKCENALATIPEVGEQEIKAPICSKLTL